MPKIDEDEIQDQVVAQADDEDEDLDEDDFDDEDEDDQEESEDDSDDEEVAVLKEIEIAEQNHKNAVAEYSKTVADIRQRQIDSIKELSKTGIKVADIAKVYPRKLVNEAIETVEQG